MRLDLLTGAGLHSIFENMFLLNKKIGDFLGSSDKLFVMTGRTPRTLYLIGNVIIVLRIDNELVVAS
jgi:hypothetical protein